MALRDYLATEVGEDWADGLITRREALRRLALLGVSVPAATAILAACSGGNDSATATTTTSAAEGSTSTSAAPTTTSTTAAPTSTSAAPTTTTTAAAGAAATPRPTERITFAGPSGVLQASYSGADAATKGGVLLIHENRGLTDHFVALPGRFAASGYNALAIDLLSAEGGTASFSDPARATAALGAAGQERLTADVKAGLDELARRTPGRKLAVVGFCFGGGQVWQLLNAGTDERLAAAVPFYGPGPANPDFSRTTAAVLGIYAEADARVNASLEPMRTALTAAGRTFELKVFPGVDHAFFNDTGARYNATQAAAAYDTVLAWFSRHLR